MRRSVRTAVVAAVAVVGVAAGLLVAPSAQAAGPDLGPVISALPGSASGGGTGSLELNDLVATTCNAGAALADAAWFQLPAGTSGSVYARAHRLVSSSGRGFDEVASTAVALVDVGAATVLSCDGSPATANAARTTAAVVWISAADAAFWADQCQNAFACALDPDVFVDRAAPVPANDDVADATVVTSLPATYTGNSALATDDGPEGFSSCLSIGTSYDAPTSTVWWTWTPPQDGYLDVTATGTGWSPCTAIADTDTDYGAPYWWYDEEGAARRPYPVLAGHQYLVSVSRNFARTLYENRPLQTGGPFRVAMSFTPGPGPVTSWDSAQVGADGVSITWAPPTSVAGSLPVTGYDVAFQRVGDAGAPTVLHLGADATTATFTGLALGFYDAVVTARTSAGPGQPVTVHTSVWAPAGPVVLTAVSRAPGEITVSWSDPPAAPYTNEALSYRVQLVDSAPGSVPRTATFSRYDAPSTTFTGLVSGHGYDVTVTGLDLNGDGTPVTRRVSLTAAGFSGPRASPPVAKVRRGDRSVTATWSAPAYTGTSAISGYRVRVYAGTSRTLLKTVTVAASRRSAVVGGLVNGRVYTLDVAALNASGAGAASTRSNLVAPGTVPGAPVVGRALSGASGGTTSATATWAAPASNGGLVIKGYVVTAWRYDRAGRLVSTQTSSLRPATARAYSWALPLGWYRFSVRAVNAAGAGRTSARSALAVSR